MIGMPILRCADVTVLIFIFNDTLSASYLRKYLTDLHQIFRICIHMGGRERSHFCFEKIGIPYTLPSFCALAFHNGWDDRNKDERVNTADDPSVSDKNLVNFGPVTLNILQVRLRRASYTLGFVTHF